MRVVVHTGADRLQVGHLRPVRLAALAAMVQRLILDVDDHAVSVPGEGGAFLSVPPLVLAVHCQKAEHHQVEEGPDDRQAYEDIHEAKGHVQGLFLQGSVLLEGHKVPKAYSCQCDKTVVVGLEKAPVLVMGEGRRSDAQRADAGEESHSHHVLHGHVGDPHAAALLDALQEVLDKSVHPLAQTLEHDKSQRDSQDCVKHAKSLARVSPWCCMPVAWGREQTPTVSKAEHST